MTSPANMLFGFVKFVWCTIKDDESFTCLPSASLLIMTSDLFIYINTVLIDCNTNTVVNNSRATLYSTIQ